MTVRPFKRSLRNGTSWFSRGLVIITAAVLVGGFTVVTQPTPQEVDAAVACKDQTFRPSSTKKTCVKYIQTMLNNLMINGRFPNPPLASDGYFGPKTTDAVRNFQSWEGIGVDGSVGPITW